ncbi:YlzJ-like family protein [Bacillus sp. FSL W7-1360]
MILYTHVPLEHIFPEDASAYQSQMTIPCPEGHLIVEQIDGGDWRIVRLLSSDPNAFLNPAYEPGMVLRAGPKLD